MSSKSNNDNHSNQLNPNNDAYYSSRGISGYDDDDEYYPAVDWRQNARDEARMQHQMEMLTPINEEFTIDFMNMKGISAHLKATAQLPHKHFNSSRFTDCTDLIELVLYPRLYTVFEQEAKSPIVFSRVRDSDGNELTWLQHEYRPRSICKIHDSPERKQQITQLNKLWEQSTKFKVDNFKKLLQDYNAIPREDVGFIITPENYRQVRGY